MTNECNHDWVQGLDHHWHCRRCMRALVVQHLIHELAELKKSYEALKPLKMAALRLGKAAQGNNDGEHTEAECDIWNEGIAYSNNWKEKARNMGYGTNGLTFNTLRSANLKRLPMFRDAKGRTCHSKKDGSDWSPAQWLQAVTGELGEYANLRKKVERGDLTIEEARPLLADELADVVIYLDILAAQLNVNLGEAVMEKWNRTSRKVGAPLYIDAEDWHYLTEEKAAK